MSSHRLLVRALRGLLLAIALSSSGGAHGAESPEDFAVRSFIELYRARLSGSVQTPGAADALLEYWGEASARRARLRAFRDAGRSYSAPLLRFLEDEHLPRLEERLRAAALKPSESQWRRRRELNQAELSKTLARFQEEFGPAIRARPELRRILSYAAFSRSETLADGTIGSWNPTSAASIQSSSLEGLKSVLAEIERGDFRNQPVTIETLQGLHARLLGAAAHHYSQAGRINEIVFTSIDGRQTHVRDYLKQLEPRLRSAPSVVQAFEIYDEFLHLHPFGDSNGRIAELLKQLILDKAGLPPLLTPEKTAIENYCDQALFGGDDPAGRAVRELHETALYLRGWLRVLSAEGPIVGTDLQGTTVIARTQSEGGVRSFFAVRAHIVELDRSLPPIKGTPVLAGRELSSLRMRLSPDGWKSYVDLAPEAEIEVPRQNLGLRTTYGIFSAPAVPVTDEREFAHELAYHYRHANGQDVWFNNQGRNYSSAWRAESPSCRRAIARAIGR